LALRIIEAHVAPDLGAEAQQILGEFGDLPHATPHRTTHLLCTVLRAFEIAFSGSRGGAYRPTLIMIDCGLRPPVH